MNNSSISFSLFFFMLIALLASCETHKAIRPQTNGVQINSAIFRHTVEEVRARTLQALNIAELRLDNELQYNKDKREPVIFVDVEEALLDAKSNSFGFETRSPFRPGSPVPGMENLIQKARSNGVRIIYVVWTPFDSAVTVARSLREQGLAANESDIVYRGRKNPQLPSAKSFLSRYRPLLVLSDEVDDVLETFYTERQGQLQRQKLRQALMSKLIVLPDPALAQWEHDVFDNFKESQENQQVRL